MACSSTGRMPPAFLASLISIATSSICVATGTTTHAGCAGKTSTCITSTIPTRSSLSTDGTTVVPTTMSSRLPISLIAATTPTVSGCRAPGYGGCASTATGEATVQPSPTFASYDLQTTERGA